jgi:cell division protease FtsH
MDADEFHQQSLKITVPKIKEALQLRFRNEQIARLGNTHIIYPAFKRESFEKIIWLELIKIQDLIKEKENTQLFFDESVVELIYKEGVYPTQGTRPIYTTIQQLIKTKLGAILTERLNKKLEKAEIFISYQENQLRVDYIKGDLCTHTIHLTIELNLDKLRTETKDDMQAIIAVHESGHAIVSTILLNTVPDSVYSKTADAGMGGFAAITYKWKYISKQQVMGRLAVLMAGHAAEKIIFGEEHITNGAAGDLQHATQFIAHILKETGLGTVMGTIQTKSTAPGYLLKDELNAEVHDWLKKAYTLAEATLRTQEPLLLHMANYLSDHRKLTKLEIIEMVKQHNVKYNMADLIENADHLYYRKELKRKVYQGEMPKVKMDSIILNSKVDKEFIPKI